MTMALLMICVVATVVAAAALVAVAALASGFYHEVVYSKKQRIHGYNTHTRTPLVDQTGSGTVEFFPPERRKS